MKTKCNRAIDNFQKFSLKISYGTKILSGTDPCFVEIVKKAVSQPNYVSFNANPTTIDDRNVNERIKNKNYEADHES